ncbi:DinB family protein [Cellulomonas cellasea]|uniref:Putative damage-inducible protein DinB n=1 Tax=Cellulomonas cellasea TaxID=43670 RepID=A0A7W4YCH5_9CELL|nr:DinB family protein [Cellulomonas cellasea]MBB2923722.1 putative damage-inducible protein DinB [Cellulomonas cellasea]
MATIEDSRGTAFEDVDMTGSRFTRVDLTGSTFRAVGLYGVVMRDVEVSGTTIDGEIASLVVNGVDVAPLVEAELDRRHPERALFRATTADGFRAAWDANERLWAETVDRARRLPEEQLHESVGEEWSFVQTLRHLAFASQSWVGRGVLGDPSPWHPLSLPWDGMEPREGVPHDRDARPTLDDALAVRLAGMALVRRALDGLTDERLDLPGPPLVGPGWPDEGRELTPQKCLRVVLNEEWWHRRYAERDLAVLESGG